MSPKKILFVATEYGSGMSAFSSTIVDTMCKDPAFEVSFLKVIKEKTNKIEDYFSFAKEVQIVIYPKKKWQKLIYKVYPLKIIRCLRRMMNDKQYDVIHFLTGDFSLFPWLFLTNRWDVRFYYTVHDLQQHEYNFPFLKRMLYNYFFWGTSNMHKYIYNLNTSSHEQLLKLKELYPQKKIFYSHAPTVITKQIVEGNQQVKELIGLNGYILFFGSVDIYKGVDILIEAYRKSEIKKKYKLVIAGKGIEYDNHTSDIIRLNRFIADEEVKSLFENSVFTVYPYLSATQSAIMALSFYFHKKAILSDIPFFVENKTKDSIYFKCKNVDDLKEKMDNMIIENANYESYEQLYSKDVLINDFKIMYGL